MFSELPFYSPSTRLIDYPDLDKKLVRICSEYLYADYFDRETELGCSDAISLGMLIAREPYGQVKGQLEIEKTDFYRRCFVSLCNGLKIDLERSASNPRVFERWSPLYNLTRFRAKIIDFGDEFGEVLLGDPWFFGGRDRYAKFPYAIHIDNAKEWYLDASDRLIVEGIQVIDSAICEILGWDYHAKVKFTDLVGYPNIEEAWDRFGNF